MNQKSDSDSVSLVDGCVYPTGPGQVCGVLVKHAKPGAGRPPLYCDNPDHTRANAYVARRGYELAAARSGGQDGDRQGDLAVSEHPVSDGLVSFGNLLTKFEKTSVQMTAILERITEAIRTVSDPEAAGYEVEQTQREAAVQVAQAKTAQAAAEQEARHARHQAARETEQRAQAEQAANQALHHIDQLQSELTDAHNTRIRAEADKQSTQQAAERDRATIEALRRQLNQQRQDLETLRQQAHDERIALAQHYTDQITALLATLHHTNPADPKPATPKTHRSRAKKQ
jgi:colicin import membrane protein